MSLKPEASKKSAEKYNLKRFYILLSINVITYNILSSILAVWMSSALAQSVALFFTYSTFFCIIFYKNHLAMLLGLFLGASGALSLFLMSGLHFPKLPILISLIILSIIIGYLIWREIKTNGGVSNF
jgi:hypothetical protein